MKMMMLVFSLFALSACCGKPASAPAATAAQPTVGEERDPAAGEMLFALNCKEDTRGRVGAPSYRVLKIAKQVHGKWENSYAVEIKPLNPTVQPLRLALKENGNGDEDYHDFDVVGSDKRGLGEVTIQDQFAWATLQNSQGSIFAKCQK